MIAEDNSESIFGTILLQGQRRILPVVVKGRRVDSNHPKYVEWAAGVIVRACLLVMAPTASAITIQRRWCHAVPRGVCSLVAEELISPLHCSQEEECRCDDDYHHGECIAQAANARQATVWTFLVFGEIASPNYPRHRLFRPWWWDLRRGFPRGCERQKLFFAQTNTKQSELLLRISRGNFKCSAPFTSTHT